MFVIVFAYPPRLYGVPSISKAPLMLANQKKCPQNLKYDCKIKEMTAKFANVTAKLEN